MLNRIFVGLFAFSLIVTLAVANAGDLDQYSSKLGPSEQKQEAALQAKAYNKGKAAGVNYTRGTAKADGYASMNKDEKTAYKRGYRGQ